MKKNLFFNVKRNFSRMLRGLRISLEQIPRVSHVLLDNFQTNILLTEFFVRKTNILMYGQGLSYSILTDLW